MIFFSKINPALTHAELMLLTDVLHLLLVVPLHVAPEFGDPLHVDGGQL